MNEPEILAYEIIERGASRAITRLVVGMPKRNVSHLAQTANVPKDKVEHLYRVWVAERQKANAVVKTRLTVGGSDYRIFSRLVEIADQFCLDAGLPQPEGYRYYVNRAIQLMNGRVNITRLESMAQPVYDRLNVERRIAASSQYDDVAKALHDQYLAKLSEVYKYGTASDYWTNPEKRMCFYEAAKALSEEKAKPEVWVAAQFEGLAFTGKPPTINQLYGENSILRYRNYCLSLQPEQQDTSPEEPEGGTDYWAYVKSIQNETDSK